jgi:hypothetical protein
MILKNTFGESKKNQQINKLACTPKPMFMFLFSLQKNFHFNRVPFNSIQQNFFQHMVIL